MYKWFKWRISDLRSVSARVNARRYPCAKGCNSSASQWLSGEQVRLYLGDPKVHFGTIVEGSWWGGGGVLGGPSGLCHYLGLGTSRALRTIPIAPARSCFSIGIHARCLCTDGKIRPLWESARARERSMGVLCRSPFAWRRPAYYQALNVCSCFSQQPYSPLALVPYVCRALSRLSFKWSVKPLKLF